MATVLQLFKWDFFVSLVRNFTIKSIVEMNYRKMCLFVNQNQIDLLLFIQSIIKCIHSKMFLLIFWQKYYQKKKCGTKSELLHTYNFFFCTQPLNKQPQQNKEGSQ